MGEPMTQFHRGRPTTKSSLIGGARLRPRQDRLWRIKWPRGVDLVPRHHQLEADALLREPR
jgi:hypothetical protein